jgi:hypothetical protein
MSQRTVVYVPDGVKRYVSPEDLVACWRKYTTRIPCQHVCGTAQHETNYVLNELDTEPSGFQSGGLLQLDSDEAKAAGRPKAVLYDLDDACFVFANRCEFRLDTILAAADLDEPTPDVWAYLAIAHNQGLGRFATAARRKPGEHPGALGSIADYGLDWPAYKARNPQYAHNMIPYGDDCISGGEKWDRAAAYLAANPIPLPLSS